MRYLLTLFVVAGSLSLGAGQPPSSALKLDGAVQKIWDQGAHNAFTDLVRFQDKWYCAFREGTGHAAGTGKIRVLVSADGIKWASAALLEKDNVDLRDPHLSITPDGRLMINGGAAWPPTRDPVKDHYSWVSFSKDGKTWTDTQRVLNSWQWLWRITWHKGTGYGVAYSWEQVDKVKNYYGTLYKTSDGLHYEKVSDLTIPQTTEATVRFDGDTMHILQRRDGSPNTAVFGTAQPPYTSFTWIDLGMYYGGPNFLKAPNGAWWTAGRIIKDKVAKTVLGRLDVKNGKLEPVLELPSGGDTSYAGMVWHDGQLWVSYYSSHEKKSSIYLARVKVSAP